MVVLPLPLKPRYCIEPSVRAKKRQEHVKKYLFFPAANRRKKNTHTQTLQTVNRGLFYFELVF